VEPERAGVREQDGVPDKARAKAAAGSNINLTQTIKEVLSCQDLMEQGPWGPVP